jgi:stalled ribosome rescue protein Dom34
LIVTELADVRSGNGEIDIVPIPEPTTFSLLALGGLAGLRLLRWKRMF